MVKEETILIGDTAFQNQKNNEKISILSSVKYINNGDFEDWVVYGCDSLEGAAFVTALNNEFVQFLSCL